MPSVLVDTNTDGDTLVPAADRQTILVKGINLTAAGQVVVTLKLGDTVIWKTYAMNDAAVKGGIVVPFAHDRDLGAGVVGEALKIGLSAAVAVAGTIDYVTISPGIQTGG